MIQDNYTKVPNEILDNPELDVYERAILVIIARKTIGYGKKSDGISLSQFMKLGNIGKTKVISTIKKLEARGLITATRQRTKAGGYSYTRYSLKVVLHANKSCPPRGQQIAPDANIHEDNSTKDNRQNNLVEREKSRGFSRNIYHSLAGAERVEAVEAYIKDSIDMYVEGVIENKIAYRTDLRQKFISEDPMTLELFEQWYLQGGKI